MTFGLDEIKSVDSLVLAHIGDAYFSLFARTKLLTSGYINVNNLHKMSAEIVSANSQKDAYFAIEDRLTEEETEIFKRGRNAKSHAKKNTKISTYHISTGFEALLGFLYLAKNFDRLNEICETAFESITEKWRENNK